jgi:structural maintenance of chromosome 2
VAFDNELADLERDLKAKKQEIVDAELALKKLDHDIGLVAKEKSSAEGLKENLEKQFTWIVDEHQCVGSDRGSDATNGVRFFGKPGTPYDFKGVNLPQAREQCRELEAQQKGLGRKINTKVMNMIDK